MEVIMMLTRRSMAVGSAVAAAATLAARPEAVAASPHRRRRVASTEGGQAVLDWEQVSFNTVYGLLTAPLVTPIPVGAPVLGFVSLAMYRAVCDSAHLGNSSESAAVAAAAHDVLVAYYPTQAGPLQAALDATLGAVGPGESRTKGVRIGTDAAREMIEARQGDGYLDSTIHYSKPSTAPYWQPTPPGTDMLAPWLGSLRNLVVEAEPISGPYTLGSSAWADDYEEVRAVGSNSSTVRTPAQTATAIFHNSTNAGRTIGEALVRYLAVHPLGILETARVFAQMHGALTDTFICTWQQKRDVGFWRPFQAISGAHDDGNPGTTPQPGWAPLIPNPQYSEYLSGHGSGTSPQVEVIRRVFGEATSLELRSPALGARTYAHLSEIEHEAFHARIWGGLHYRKAMRDTYEMGHSTAWRVMSVVV
jgi:hypothetical protein